MTTSVAVTSAGRGRMRSGTACAEERRSRSPRRPSPSNCSLVGALQANNNNSCLPLAWQPRHTVTRRTARIAREVYSAWCSRVGPIEGQLSADQAKSLFNDMQLFPSQAQVHEMVECTKECADRGSPGYLTFGEFCVFATELKRCYERGVPRPGQLARLLERDGEEKNKRARKMSKVSSKHEVFLGGSCNPTTWRQDIAIPLLNSLGISFYNPQVSEWRAELIETEHVAKENACVLFYVIDSRTRNVVSLIESAHFAGARRKLVLVIDPYRPGQTVAGEPITAQEYEELSCSLITLQDLVEKQGIPVFNNIPVAINCTAKILRNNLSMQDLGVNDFVPPTKPGHVQVGDKLFKLREAFDALDTTGCGRISLADVCMASRLLTNRKLSVTEISGSTANHQDGSQGCRPTVDFEQFCAIVSDVKPAAGTNGTTHVGGTNGTTEKWVLCARPQRPKPAAHGCRDLYLGGAVMDTTWRDLVAIPMIKERGLSYLVPERSDRLGSSEAAAIEACSVLLFNITNTARALQAMAVAAHYIGLGHNVVLCIQQLSEGSTIGSDKLTQQATNDYNRGRMYLADLARRDGFPVFHSVTEAVQYSIDKCTTR